MRDDLYQRAIMDHARAAIGDGRLADADASVSLDNPLCGDRVGMDVRIADGGLAALAHRVRGCALSRAAASVIGARAAGQPVEDLRALRREVAAMLEAGAAPPWPELSAFNPVRAYKSRHECVLLPFEALDQALAAAAGGADGTGKQGDGDRKE